MKRSKVTLSLVALSLIIPLSAICFSRRYAIAENIKVRTNNVQVTTNSNGEIQVDTGKTAVSVPSRHRNWYPWRYWRTPWQSNCRHSAQQTTQMSNSDGKVVSHSSTSSYCR